MKIVKQLSVFLENKPGTLSKVCRALAHEGVNIYAMTVSDTIDHAVIRIVVSDHDKAVRMFEATGVLVVETDVIQIDLKNEPGQLAKLSDKLSLAGINIDYAYCAAEMEQKKGALILRVNDTKEALKVLKDFR